MSLIEHLTFEQGLELSSSLQQLHAPRHEALTR
jgi:hypothetical protein